MSPMKRVSPLLLLLMPVLSFAQEQDPKAKAILDEVSRITKSHKTITADVVFTALDKEKKPVDKPQNWKIQSKGQKFRLEIPGTTIMSDGKTLWNYNKDAKEVTIKHFDPDNDEQNPAKIFTMYENGYKYKYDKEEKIGAVTCHVIDLFPAVKPEKKKYHTVILYVDKAKKEVVRMRMMMKDGGSQTFDVKSLKPNLEIPDSQFIFEMKGLKADQINDERD
jgi:outer membrane lipoprotein-sorting protein